MGSVDFYEEFKWYSSIYEYITQNSVQIWIDNDIYGGFAIYRAYLVMSRKMLDNTLMNVGFDLVTLL